jgi:penicillin-binding protein 1C
MNRLTGYRSAALIARDILVKLHPREMQGQEDLSFPPPRGYSSARVCALSGKRASAACEHVFLEWFRPGTEPNGECPAHVRLAVDTRTGTTATLRTPRRFVEFRTLTAFEGRYAAWAQAAGLPRLPGSMDGRVVLFGGATSSHLAGRRGRSESPPAPGLGTAASGSLRITSPPNGLHLLRDPETPDPLATLGLAAVADPPPKQILWYVDGKPFSLADYPFSTRWPLAPGEHFFQAKLPYTETASPLVRITVQ